MSMQEHVESLRLKHAQLELLINEETHRPLPDQALLTHLKRQKLRIKEEIERTRSGNGAALAGTVTIN
jgi:hypothetical protein